MPELVLSSNNHVKSCCYRTQPGIAMMCFLPYRQKIVNTIQWALRSNLPLNPFIYMLVCVSCFGFQSSNCSSMQASEVPTQSED